MHHRCDGPVNIICWTMQYSSILLQFNSVHLRCCWRCRADIAGACLCQRSVLNWDTFPSGRDFSDSGGIVIFDHWKCEISNFQGGGIFTAPGRGNVPPRPLPEFNTTADCVELYNCPRKTMRWETLPGNTATVVAVGDYFSCKFSVISRPVTYHHPYASIGTC